MSNLWTLVEKQEARATNPNRTRAEELISHGQKTGRLSNSDYRDLKSALRSGNLCYEDFGVHKGNVNDWNARWMGENGCGPRD
ncbi:MAG: hypothetical protein VX730_07945 [Pseudomonadota bacterium]|nr:hypothetical protein [Pseudomonadota bacterium]